MSDDKVKHKRNNFRKRDDRFEKICVIAIVVIFVASVLIFKFINSDTRKNNYIKRQLRRSYDIVCQDDLSVSDNSFFVTTEDGISIVGTCSKFGKIESENYINHYYGFESAARITDEIAECFDDCVIVANNEFSHAWREEVETDTIHSYDEYLAAHNQLGSEELVKGLYVFVYIRENEDIEHVKTALSVLKNNEETIEVIICALPDGQYEAHRDFGKSVYTGGPYMDGLNDERGSGYHELFLNETVFGCNGKVGGYTRGYSWQECEYYENGEWVDIP